MRYRDQNETTAKTWILRNWTDGRPRTWSAIYISHNLIRVGQWRSCTYHGGERGLPLSTPRLDFQENSGVVFRLDPVRDKDPRQSKEHF